MNKIFCLSSPLSIFGFMVLTLFHLSAAVVIHAATIENERVRQDGNRVIFEFDVQGNEAETGVEVTLMIEGRRYRAKSLHLEGDVGVVKVGSGKKIFWNVLQDFPRGYSGDVEWEIKASRASSVSRPVPKKDKKKKPRDRKRRDVLPPISF